MTARLQFAGLVLVVALSISPLAFADAPATPLAENFHEATLTEYRQHLTQLQTVVAVCAKARDQKSCDPALVGQDDSVPLGNAPNPERRMVRYGWLRALLTEAQEKDKVEVKDKVQDKKQNQPAAPTQIKTETQKEDDADEDSERETKPQSKATISEFLQAAEVRLTEEIAKADELGELSPAAADHVAERSAMQQVLSGRDFRNLEMQTRRDSALEKLGAWLNGLFANIGKLQEGAAWVGKAIFWGFLLAVCVGLAWALVQLERRSRLRLIPESDGPAAGGASARDWQLWLADARKAAAQSEWREAIHFVYWAAISRLESKRLWPADRARTPREYLALVAADDQRKPGLVRLTGSFERVWYGGRAAGEGDYQKAEELADGLISGGGSSRGETR